MSEDVSNLFALRPANSPNAFDLRRVGAHPDYWYPLAWSDGLKIGRTLGRRFEGHPIVSVRQRTDDGAAGAHCAGLDKCIRGRRPAVHRFSNSLEQIAHGINI